MLLLLQNYKHGAVTKVTVVASYILGPGGISFTTARLELERARERESYHLLYIKESWGNGPEKHANCHKEFI